MPGLRCPVLSVGHGATPAPTRSAILNFHFRIPSTPALTSLTQSDMMWVLGVRKWKLRTMTQMITTAVTSSMMKSRYLWGAQTCGWHCHRDWAQAELPSAPQGPHDIPPVPSGTQDSLADEGDGVGGGRQALGDEQEEDRLGQEHRDHQRHLLTTWRGELRANLATGPPSSAPSAGISFPVSHHTMPRIRFSVIEVPQGHMWGILCLSVPQPGCLAGMMVSCTGMSQYQDVPVLSIGVSPCPRTWRCPMG